MQLTPDWAGSVFDQLDRRLSRDTSRPVAVAVSGGGDSMALLHLASDWASRRGRRLLVLSVDHGLSPDGPAWNARVGAAADSLKADWQGLIWSGDKPATGLPAAARRARHALLADAARHAGARVVLMGHTADDVAEADWMRTRGTPLGRVKAWSPSPVWPEGRGLMLLRPLLDVSRRDLRNWLSAMGIDWIEDPANADDRFLRSRARAAAPEPGRQPTAMPPPADLRADAETGVISAPPGSPWLGPAVACASGRETIPAAAALKRLSERVAQSGGPSSLSGALVQLLGADLLVSREIGRHSVPDHPLEPGIVHIWDGRFALRACDAGWNVGLAGGRRARLSPQDRRRLNLLVPEARRSHPVLFRDGEARPVLADPAVEMTCLVAGRLRLATGQVQTEDDL